MTGGSGASVYGVTVILLNYAHGTAFDAISAAVGGTATAASLAFNID